MDGLKIVLEEALNEEYKGALKDFLPEETIEKLKQENDIIFYAYAPDDGVIGALAAKQEETELEIRYIYVAPQVRRFGVGSALLQFFVEQFEKPDFIRPVTALYPGADENEDIILFFESQLNFDVRLLDKENASLKDQKMYKAIWNCTRLIEWQLLFEPDAEVEIDFYQDLNAVEYDQDFEEIDEYFLSDKYELMEDVNDILTMDD